MNEQDPFGDPNVIKLLFLATSTVIAAGAASNHSDAAWNAHTAIQTTQHLFTHLGIPLPSNSKES